MQFEIQLVRLLHVSWKHVINIISFQICDHLVYWLLGLINWYSSGWNYAARFTLCAWNCESIPGIWCNTLWCGPLFKCTHILCEYFICCVVLVLFAYGSCTYLGFLRFSLCCRFYFLLKPWAFSMRAWGVFYESLGHFLMRAWEFCIRPWPFCFSIDCLYIISIDISTFKISSIRLTIIGTILSRFHPFDLQGSCNICFYLFALLFFFLFYLDPAVLPIPY